MSKIFVRADGNAIIGIGHLMRTMAVMDQLKGKTEITYLCAMEESVECLRQKGWNAICLQTPPERMEEELAKLKSIFEETNCRNLLIVDNYNVTDDYLKALDRWCDVLLFDDLGEHVFPVRGIVNYHCYVDQNWYEAHYPEARLFLGAGYVPLRAQFTAPDTEAFCQKPDEAEDLCRKDLCRMADGAEIHVLLTTGGGDSENIGGRILEKIYRENVMFHWILGPFSPNLPFAKAFAEKRTNVIIESNVEDMAALMRKCSLAITAGGSTIYELWATRLPMIAFSYAENQEKLVRFVGENVCGFDAGAYDRNPAECLENIKKYFETAISNPEIISRFSYNAWKLSDGRGAWRLAGSIMEWLNCLNCSCNF